jgi:hypothetical protein
MKTKVQTTTMVASIDEEEINAFQGKLQRAMEKALQIALRGPQALAQFSDSTESSDSTSKHQFFQSADIASDIASGASSMEQSTRHGYDAIESGEGYF